MRQSTFMLDALGERPFPGYTGGEAWNGFACPYFDFDQAQVLVAAWREQGWAAHYDETADAFVFSVNQDFETGKSDESEAFAAVEIEGHKFYPIGAFGWTWEEQHDHKNRVQAQVPEAWVLDTVEDLLESDEIIERAVEKERLLCESALEPNREALEETRTALLENQKQIEQLINTIGSGVANSDLLGMLNERATQLRLSRERLKAEERKLAESVNPLNVRFDAAEFRVMLTNFHALARVAEEEELQHLIRLMVRRIEWMPEGKHRVQYYLPRPAIHKEWFATQVQSDGAGCRSREPLIQICREVTGSIIAEAVTVFRSVAWQTCYSL